MFFESESESESESEIRVMRAWEGLGEACGNDVCRRGDTNSTIPNRDLTRGKDIPGGNGRVGQDEAQTEDFLKVTVWEKYGLGKIWSPQPSTLPGPSPLCAP